MEHQKSEPRPTGQEVGQSVKAEALLSRAVPLALQIRSLSRWMHVEVTTIRREQLDRAFFAIGHGLDYVHTEEHKDVTIIKKARADETS